jgi:hypothetical protein
LSRFLRPNESGFELVLQPPFVERLGQRGDHACGCREQHPDRRKSAVRSIVEHPFLTLKRLWGFAKVRYRGLAKNANRTNAMLALINVSKWGRPLTGEVRPA